MQAISKINLPELAPQSSANVTLTTRCGISLHDGTVCMLLMRQTRSRYSNQELPEGTLEMFLTEWEEMIQQYGLEVFREALSTAIRASKFFPAPDEIRDAIGTVLEARRAVLDREREATLRRAEIAEFWGWFAPEWMSRTGKSEAELLNNYPSFRNTKAQWLRERAEDAARGEVRA